MEGCGVRQSDLVMVEGLRRPTLVSTQTGYKAEEA